MFGSKRNFILVAAPPRWVMVFGKQLVMKSLVLFAFACSASVASFAAPQSEDPFAAEWRNTEGIPTSGARVEIHKQNEIAVDVPGTLITLDPARRGGFVQKGQTVVEVDSSIAEAELKQLEHKAASTILIDFARVTLEKEQLRLQDMKDRNATAGSTVFTDNEMREQELAIKKATAEVAKSLDDQQAEKLATATKRVELTKYKKVAQISGIVTDLHHKAAGTSVRQGDPIMTIVNFEKMTVKMDVNPIYETRVKVGDRVLVRRRIGGSQAAPAAGGDDFFTTPKPAQIKASMQTTSVPEYYFEGVVIFTSSQAKGDDANSFEVEAVIDNKSVGTGNYLLKEGVRISAKILSP